jgi:hypothetical protein
VMGREKHKLMVVLGVWKRRECGGGGRRCGEIVLPDHSSSLLVCADIGLDRFPSTRYISKSQGPRGSLRKTPTLEFLTSFYHFCQMTLTGPSSRSFPITNEPRIQGFVCFGESLSALPVSDCEKSGIEVCELVCGLQLRRRREPLDIDQERGLPWQHRSHSDIKHIRF